MTDTLIRQRMYPEQTHLPGLHPVLARIYASRGIDDLLKLDKRLQILPRPELLSGIDQLVEHLYSAILAESSILIVGDFDADGATSCAVAVLGLQMLGHKNVHYLVPNRFEYGYGLTAELVDFAVEQNPDLILTVDSGIACHAGVKRANELGIGVLVTDHHLPGEYLPPALAIVNPNVPGDSFPSKNLAGVGVMFYVLSALRAFLRREGYFQSDLPEPNLAELLDFVALGTVADVVKLDQINRALVYQGLARIRKGLAHPGVLALIKCAGKDCRSLTVGDLGFSIAPRLNAAGRLDDMSLGIECLINRNADSALGMAQTLDSLNRERREIEEQMKQEALKIIASSRSLNKGADQQLPLGLCLYETGWHAGVIGIVASRIKERHSRPVIAFAEENDDLLKGSARSVAGIHIRDILCQVEANNPHLIERFGGHAMAAGLTIKRKNLPAFRQAFNQELETYRDLLSGPNELWTDGELGDLELDLNFADLLEQSGPWGQGFEEPLFEGWFDVMDIRIVGQRHLKMVLRNANGRRNIDAIAFNVENVEEWLGCHRIRAVYKLAVNEYRGRRTAQLIIDYFLRDQ